MGWVAKTHPKTNGSFWPIGSPNDHRVETARWNQVLKTNTWSQRSKGSFWHVGCGASSGHFDHLKMTDQRLILNLWFLGWTPRVHHTLIIKTDGLDRTNYAILEKALLRSWTEENSIFPFLMLQIASHIENALYIWKSAFSCALDRAFLTEKRITSKTNPI